MDYTTVISEPNDIGIVLKVNYAVWRAFREQARKQGSVARPLAAKLLADALTNYLNQQKQKQTED